MAKSKYTEVIKPNFNYIFEQLANGATEKQICDHLGISYETWYKFKRSKTEFSDLIKEARLELVPNLRGALIKKALGFEYEESKEYYDENNLLCKKEVYKKQSLPDVAALNLALKNYDKENWANDPQMLEVHKQELELKKKKQEKENW